MNWEYLIIGIIFIIALYYMWNKVILPFVSKDGSDCSSGCGCGPNLDDLEKKRK